MSLRSAARLLLTVASLVVIWNAAYAGFLLTRGRHWLALIPALTLAWTAWFTPWRDAARDAR